MCFDMRNNVFNITHQNDFHTPYMSMMSKCGYDCYLQMTPKRFRARLVMPEIAKNGKGAEIFLARLGRKPDT